MKQEDYYHYSSYRPKSSDPYAYRSEPDRPKIQILGESTPPLRPFENSEGLSERVFGYKSQLPLDPLNLPADRARICSSQIDVMFQQLQSRHAISYAIRQSIEYEECATRSKLEERRDWPSDGKLDADLEKRLLALNKERWAEEVSCWRDTNRLVSGIFEHWTGYAEQNRKARLMDGDL